MSHDLGLINYDFLVLERDSKLNELDDRATTLQGRLQIEHFFRLRKTELLFLRGR